MSTHHTPRSSTELFPEALHLSPKQREVLAALQNYPQGTRAQDLADSLGMHVNTARGHLEELVHAGAVRAITAPAKGRGRPSLIFQVRIPDNRSVAEEYITLINVLSQMLAEQEELSDFDSPKAREIGRRWAEANPVAAVDNTSNPIGPILRTMRDLGFDPTIAAPTEESPGKTCMELHACPFVTAGIEPSPFVCAIHDGFLQHSAQDLEQPLELTLRPKSGNGVCEVHAARQSV